MANADPILEAAAKCQAELTVHSRHEDTRVYDAGTAIIARHYRELVAPLVEAARELAINASNFGARVFEREPSWETERQTDLAEGRERLTTSIMLTRNALRSYAAAGPAPKEDKNG